MFYVALHGAPSNSGSAAIVQDLDSTIRTGAARSLHHRTTHVLLESAMRVRKR